MERDTPPGRGYARPMRRPARLALVVPLALAACTAGTRAPRPPRPGEAPPLVVDGVPRTYRLRAPSAPPAGPVGVLLVFHGAGSDADDVARGSGLEASADDPPTLVAFPEAVGGRFDVGPGSADVRFVDALLERLRAQWTLDPRRIAATGFSNGAAFCYRLAADRPGLLAAIAPVAGYLPPVGDGPGDPVPLLHVHGDADARVAAPAGTGADDAVARWARRVGAVRGPVVTDGTVAGLAVRRVAWTGATPRADVTLLLVRGEGHAWPGGPGGPVTREVVGFLRAHPRDAGAR